MDYKNWYKFLPLNLDLDNLTAWAQQTMTEIDPHPQLWTREDKTFYRTTAPDDLWHRVNDVFPCAGTYTDPYDGLEYGPRSVFIWEYKTKCLLTRHIDGPRGAEHGVTTGYPGTTSMIIPLIGGFTVWIYRDDTDEIADQVTYYPGEIFVFKNWQYWHGGIPTDDYRLALFIFSEADIEAEVMQLFQD